MEGAVNVVMGNAPEIEDTLLASPQVSLELGGNAPCINFDDADIDIAVKGTVETIKRIAEYITQLKKSWQMTW
ncbi:hypothetical protein HN51_019061 [Arachis hypogaea]